MDQATPSEATTAGATPEIAITPQITQPEPTPGAVGAIGEANFRSTKGAKILLGAVVCGFLPVVLLSIAYAQGAYFEQCTSEDNKCYKEIYQDSSEDSCETVNPQLSSYEMCKASRNRVPEAFRSQVGACNEKWFLVIPVYIIGLAWFGSAILLVVLIVMRQKSQQVALVGIGICTVLFALSTLSLLIYVIWAFAGDYPSCFNSNRNSAYGRSLEGEDGGSHPTINSTADGRQYGYSRNCFKIRNSGLTYSSSCLDQQDYVYKVWYSLSGMIFAGVTTVLLAMAAMMSRNGRRVGNTMMGGGPMGQGPQYTNYQQSAYGTVSMQSGYGSMGYQQSGMQTMAYQQPGMQMGYQQPGMQTMAYQQPGMQMAYQQPGTQQMGYQPQGIQPPGYNQRV